MDPRVIAAGAALTIAVASNAGARVGRKWHERRETRRMAANAAQAAAHEQQLELETAKTMFAVDELQEMAEHEEQRLSAIETVVEGGLRIDNRSLLELSLVDLIDLAEFDPEFADWLGDIKAWRWAKVPGTNVVVVPFHRGVSASSLSIDESGKAWLDGELVGLENTANALRRAMNVLSVVQERVLTGKQVYQPRKGGIDPVQAHRAAS